MSPKACLGIEIAEGKRANLHSTAGPSIAFLLKEGMAGGDNASDQGFVPV